LKLTVAVGVLLVLSAAALSNAAQAQTVTRSPYLQMGAPTSMTVRWRTNVATDSVVRYGLTATDQPFTAQIFGNRTDHEVALIGLDPATPYFYSVGTSTQQPLAGGDADHMFVTSPLVGTAQPTRIWVVGDSGTNDSNARQVRDAYLNSPNLPYTNLFLMLGDNAYQNGTDSNYQQAVFNMYPMVLRQTPLWPTFGNHDGVAADSSTESGAYYDIFTLPRAAEIGGAPSGTEAYYSFDYGNIHFVVMDSFETDRSANSPMITWLRDDLLSHNQPWVIAFWHHPPYSHGSHNTDNSGEIQSREMREIALPILEEGGVDLVLGGHSHSYERSFLIDGHYGHSSTFVPSNHLIDGGNGRVDGDGAYSKPGGFIGDPHQGAVFAVAGSSGKVSTSALDHPVMAVNFNLLGSMVLDVDGDTLDAIFLDNNGVERDKFRIVKALSLPQINVVASDPTAAEAGPTGGLFAVTRAGDTAAALTVSYAVSGTATAGADYTALSGNVVIAAGQQTATIDVATIDDGLVESDETVIVTLRLQHRDPRWGAGKRHHRQR
jgi:hypothetical protein